jgi:predicted nucleic acid-binding protein
MKVFLDTNILLDVLAKREPFFADSAAIWTLAEKGKIEGLVSAVSFTNIFYVVRKLSDAKTAWKMLVLLRDSFHAVGCDHQVVSQAIDSQFKDFEDAVQFHSALHADADCIVTRNPEHFPQTKDCPVITPAEFLATHAFE